MSEHKESDWVKKAKATNAYHLSRLRDNPKHTLKETADDLQRSIGRVSEDLMLVKFMKTHPRVETFEYCREAVVYCQKIKRDQRLSS